MREYGYDFNVSGDGVYRELSPRESLPIVVQFHPRNHYGSHERELRFYGGECTNVPLTGFVVNPEGAVTSAYVVAHLDSLAEGWIIAANFRLEGLPAPVSITDEVAFDWFGDLTIGNPDFDFALALAFTEPQTGPLVPFGRLDFFTLDSD